MVAFIGRTPIITGGVNGTRNESLELERRQKWEQCESYIKNYNLQSVHTQEEVNRFLNCPQAPANVLPIGWILGTLAFVVVLTVILNSRIIVKRLDHETH